jgi:hypothetical protein
MTFQLFIRINILIKPSFWDIYSSYLVSKPRVHRDSSDDENQPYLHCSLARSRATQFGGLGMAAFLGMLPWAVDWSR